MRTVKKMRKLVVLGLAALLLGAGGCNRVPITGRNQLNMVPDSMMNSMALQSYQEFLSQNEVSDNEEQTQMVKRVGRRIADAVERYGEENDLPLEGYAWEFNLIEDEAKNAWAMPGGKVVVYTGLLTVAQTDAELAVVVGHEVAHVIAKHGSERMSQGLLVEMGGMALSTALSKQPGQTRALFMKSYGVGAQVGVLLRYSRTHESEADHLGLIFMAMAGYDPHAAVGFWEDMAAAKTKSAPPEFLSTHPSDDTRIERIKELIPEAMPYYEQAK